MQTFIKYLRIIISILLIPYGIISLFYILFGIVGDNKGDFYIIGVGFIGFIVGHIISYFRYYGWFISIIGLVMFLYGNYQNDYFWRNHNLRICEELRANPSCTWSKESISCKDHPPGSNFGFSMGATICN